MTKKNKIIIIVAAAAAVILIAAILFLNLGMKKMEADTYSISVPIMYFDAEDDTYVHLYKSYELCVLSESIDTLEELGYNITTEEEYLDLLKSSASLNLSIGFMSANGKSTELDGYSLWEFDRNMNGESYHFWVYVEKTDTAFWTIMFCSFAEEADSYAGRIPRIIKSFEPAE